MKKKKITCQPKPISVEIVMVHKINLWKDEGKKAKKRPNLNFSRWIFKQKMEHLFNKCTQIGKWATKRHKNKSRILLYDICLDMSIPKA